MRCLRLPRALSDREQQGGKAQRGQRAKEVAQGIQTQVQGLEVVVSAMNKVYGQPS